MVGRRLRRATDRTLFVYAAPGHDTLTALSTWADAYRCLWEALAERNRSVAVVHTDEEFDRAQAILEHRATAPGPIEAGGDVRAELARIERAILRGTVQVLEEFGGLQAAMRRSVALEKQVRRHLAPGLVRRASTWQTMRLAGARYR